MVRVITPPAEEPVTLAQAKLHCKEETNAQDTLIDDAITTAREYCEGVQNRAYITQTLAITLDRFPVTPFELPRPPLQGSVVITYLDEDGTPHTIPAADYVVDPNGFKGRIALKRSAAWPSVTLREIGAVTIQFVAGYGDTAAAVPNKVKQAMLLLVGDMYRFREASIDVVTHETFLTVDILLGFDRVWPI